MKKKIKTLGVVIVLFLAFFGLITVVENIQEEKGYKENIARDKIMELSLMSESITNKEEKEKRQMLVDTITMEEDWLLFDEELTLKRTHHRNFPFTANRINYFKPDNPSIENHDYDTVIVRDQLFLFDPVIEDWVSISVSQNKINLDNSEVTVMEENNKIYKNPDWERKPEMDSDWKEIIDDWSDKNLSQ